MLDPNDVERAFEKMGLGTEEERDRLSNLVKMSLPPDADDEQLFIHISDVTRPEPPKEVSGAELERHPQRDH